LSAQYQQQRRDDLTALFCHVRQTQDEAVQIVGASWLYNLRAYARLFPPDYLATACVLPQRFQRLSLWGQFLDRDGAVKNHMAQSFLQCLEQQVDIEQLAEYFAFQVLAVESSVQVFYNFYGIEPVDDLNIK
jgi:hypothetical protein